MNSRKPIFVMLALGLAVVLVLTYVPYSLFVSAGRAITSLINVSDPLEPAVEQSVPLAPAFDAAAWYVERGEDPERHGLLVESIDGTRVLASHNSDRTFNPASLIKLATSLAVLRRFGHDHRFETRVYAEGKADETGVLDGKVVVSGSDPVFGDAAASLIARELRARGVERVSDEVLVTPGFCFNYSESSEDSAERMAKVMGLKEKGTGVGAAPPGEPLFVLKSHTLREIVLYMNAHSNNFVAERLGALVGGPEGLKSFLVGELKLPAEEVEIRRTSGREHNRMTARGIVAVVRALKEEAERQGLKLEDLMPVASDDAGTLRRRLEESPLEGATLGKTGTLTAEVDGGMASLAGVVYTEKAGMIVFAILDQGSRIAENRELEDILLAQVVVAEDIPVQLTRTEERRRLLPPTSLRVEPESLAATLRDDDEDEAASRPKQTPTRDDKEVSKEKERAERRGAKNAPAKKEESARARNNKTASRNVKPTARSARARGRR